MKRICFIAQFPPPIHGLSKAVQTLYDAENKLFEYKKIDIKNNKIFLLNLIKIFFCKAELYYFTISQTKGGNIRDLIILNLIRAKKKKYIIHLHGGSYYRKMVDEKCSKFQKRMNYRIMKNAEKIIVLSESLKSTFKDMIDEEKIIEIPNCIDNKYLLDKNDFEKKYDNVDSKKIKNILYLSNFIKEKGYKYVLELAIKEKENYKKTGVQNFKFDFAGRFFNIEDKKEFFNIIKNNELEKFVNYCGIVNGEEKKKLLKEADIMILLTTYFREGQPISIIEGLGNGVMIVATNHTAIPDMVEDQINGIIIDKNNINVDNIYNKLINLSIDEYKKIIQNNYDKSKKYLEKDYVKRIQKVFSDAL